jgi:hypothetical protein
MTGGVIWPSYNRSLHGRAELSLGSAGSHGVSVQICNSIDVGVS